MRLPVGKLLALLTATAIMTACASIGPPLPPSLELPKPPTDLRAVRKGDRVTLTWTIPTATTDRQTVRSVGATRICRSQQPEFTQCGVPVAEEPPVVTSTKSPKQKNTASYTDTLPATLESDDPSSFITYAVEPLNADGRGAGPSNHVQVALARTLAPPRDFTARLTAQGVVLTWTNTVPSSSTHYLYRVHRRLEGSKDETLIGDVPAGNEPNLTLTDLNFEWQKNYEYRAEAVTVLPQKDKPDVQIEGNDSPAVKIFANDIFPPAVPSALQAVFSGPGQQPFIDLIWAPVSDVDLDGYNVYRHEEGAAPVKVNAELLKTPAYRDTTVVAGKHYRYSVSSVDVRGNESAKSEEAEETVP